MDLISVSIPSVQPLLAGEFTLANADAAMLALVDLLQDVTCPEGRVQTDKALGMLAENSKQSL